MKVVIIGGGIAGLSCAYYVKKNFPSAEIEVLEEKEYFGGTIVTHYEDGFTVEGGPDCFLREKWEGVKLAKELGIEREVVEANLSHKATFVFYNHRLYRLPEGMFLIAPVKIIPFLTSSLLSFRGKIRAGFELFIPPADKEESVAEFVQRRFGTEILEKIAEPLIGGIHAGDVRRLSADACLSAFVLLERKYGSIIRGLWKMKRGKSLSPFLTFKKGMGFLVNLLVDRLENSGVKLVPGTKVKEVTRKERNFIIKCEDKEVEAGFVILSTPAYRASVLLSSFGEISKFLSEIDYISTGTVSLAFRESDISIPKGWGVVIPSVESRRIMAVTFSSHKFPERAPSGFILLRCFVGGFLNQSLVNLDNESLTRIVKEELQTIFEVRGEPVKVWIYRWYKSMPQYNVGHRTLVEKIRKNLPEGLFLAGSGYKGVGIPDCIREAEEIAKQLKKI